MGASQHSAEKLFFMAVYMCLRNRRRMIELDIASIENRSASLGNSARFLVLFTYRRVIDEMGASVLQLFV